MNALPTPTAGAIGELVACAHLMQLGYHVYRSESPAAPFDLVAYRDGVCHRVEVKCVTSTRNSPQFSYPKNDQWDMLAVVITEDSHVFLFEPTMSRLEMRNAVRVHLGFPPAVEPVLQPCGTLAAFERHRRRRQRCEPCRDAMIEYHRQRRTPVA